jgi:hypothetical protein
MLGRQIRGLGTPRSSSEDANAKALRQKHTWLAVAKRKLS